MSASRNVIPYETIEVEGALMCLSLEYRAGRAIKDVKITPYGEVELVNEDGLIEVIGTPKKPCQNSILERLRTHHEGLLLVFFAVPGAHPDNIEGGPVGEQLVKSTFFR